MHNEPHIPLSAGSFPGDFTGDYRFGFNGKEGNEEVVGSGNLISYEFREFETRIGRYLSLDPLTKNYPWQSPFVYHRNSPVAFIDWLGLGDPEKEEDGQNDCEGCPKGISQAKGVGGVLFALPNSVKTTIFEEDYPKILGSSTRKDVRKGEVRSFTIPSADAITELPKTYYAFFNEENGDFEGYRTVDGVSYEFDATSQENISNGEVDFKALRGPLLVLGGMPILDKAFVTPGSSSHTSILSKYLGKIPIRSGIKLPSFVFSSSGSIRTVATKNVGRFTARWVPVLGWGLTAYDVGTLMNESYKNKQKFEEYVIRVVLDGNSIEFLGQKAMGSKYE